MSLRPEELRAVAAELKQHLVGAFVQKAHAPLPRLCFLELRVPGQSVRICISAEPQFARLSVADARIPSPESPPPFQQWLRRELIGARLADVALIDPYVVRLLFETKERQRAVIAELRGSGANIFLVDDTDRVLAAAIPEGERTRPGATWTLNPTPPEEVPKEGPARLKPEDASMFATAEAAEALFGARERQRRAQEIRKRLTGPVRARLGRVDRTKAKVEADAARGEDAEAHREQGELIAQNLHRIGRGEKTAKVTRWTEEGPQEVEVTIDPRRTPKEQADWHFHQYKRLTRGVDHALRRLIELEEERERLARELEVLDARSDEDLLEHVSLIAQPAKKGPEKGKPYKEFVAATGARILVGRSSEANDELTFRIARPFDLWLHARGVPGSHVILECQKNQDVPPEALLDAATLAHHHSTLKGEPRGEVAYTQVKFVKKQKGGGPGQVIFTRDKSIVVRVEPERLERLMRARAEG